MAEASELHTACVDTPNFTHLQHSSHCEGDCGIGNGLVISKDDGLTWYNFFILENKQPRLVEFAHYKVLSVGRSRRICGSVLFIAIA